MAEWYHSLSLEVKSLLISSIVSVSIFYSKSIYSSLHDKYSFNYKMKKEYNFEQKKNIKQLLAKTKTPLIKSAEELNYRLWNLNNNIDECWHNIPKNKWKQDQRYYLRSFTYRFLTFLYWIIKAEKSIYSFDLNEADKADTQYLKYIKTLKHFFCDGDLLSELGYPAAHCSNHFYKDDLVKYCNYINNEEDVIDFQQFELKFKTDYNDIEKVVKYITEIRNTNENLNYNTIKSFHLFLMLFLNKYGLDYHHTSKEKLMKLMKEDKYVHLKIKKGLLNFLKRNKVLHEARVMVKRLGLQDVISESV